jgi:hypothetical protein
VTADQVFSHGGPKRRRNQSVWYVAHFRRPHAKPGGLHSAEEIMNGESAALSCTRGVSYRALQQCNACMAEGIVAGSEDGVIISYIHRLARPVNSAFRHDSMGCRNPGERLTPPTGGVQGGQRHRRMADDVEMPSCALANLVLAHLVPDQQGCLDSEQTYSAVTQVAHSCGNYRRNRPARHCREAPVRQGSRRLLPNRHTFC